MRLTPFPSPDAGYRQWRPPPRPFATTARSLAKSKLVPAEEVDRLHAKWRDETNDADDQVDSFRKFLIGRRVLTEYQAALIQRGRADNFFLGRLQDSRPHRQGADGWRLQAVARPRPGGRAQDPAGVASTGHATSSAVSSARHAC